MLFLQQVLARGSSGQEATKGGQRSERDLLRPPYRQTIAHLVLLDCESAHQRVYAADRLARSGTPRRRPKQKLTFEGRLSAILSQGHAL